MNLPRVSLRRGKYRPWPGGYVIKVWVRHPGSGKLYVDDVEVTQITEMRVAHRLEVLPYYFFGIMAVRGCFPGAIPRLMITDDFGHMINLDSENLFLYL